MKRKTEKIISTLLATPFLVVAIAVGNSNAIEVAPLEAKTATGGMEKMRGMDPQQRMEMMRSMSPEQRQQMMQQRRGMMHNMDPQQRQQMMQQRREMMHNMR